MAAGAAIAYPLLLRVLGPLVSDKDLTVLTFSFTPAVSILFGTLLSLTLSITYGRVRRIQDLSASETADVALLTRVVVGLFASEEHAA